MTCKTAKKNKKPSSNCFFLIVCECFIHINVCVTHVFLGLMEARKKHPILWNCSYRHLWTGLWMLRFKPRSSAGEPSALKNLPFLFQLQCWLLWSSRADLPTWRHPSDILEGTIRRFQGKSQQINYLKNLYQETENLEWEHEEKMNFSWRQHDDKPEVSVMG